MLTREDVHAPPSGDFTTVLPGERRWGRLTLVAAGSPQRDALEAARTLARRDGAQILLYDVAASGGFTSPYPSQEGTWLPKLLQEADMRRVGRHDLAEVAGDLDREGLLAGIYLAPKTGAEDLDALAEREGVDLVISLLPFEDRRLSHVHEVRRHAHLLLAPPGERPVLHPPLRDGEIPPVPQRVRWSYLIVVLVTFLLARRRNQG